jgi:hypothetical protein
MRTIYREHCGRREKGERGSGSGSALLAARSTFRFDFSVDIHEIEMYGASILSLRFRSMSRHSTASTCPPHLWLASFALAIRGKLSLKRYMPRDASRTAGSSLTLLISKNSLAS